MDVELQILKHLPRDAHPTVAIIDGCDLNLIQTREQQGSHIG